MTQSLCHRFASAFSKCSMAKCDPFPASTYENLKPGLQCFRQTQVSAFCSDIQREFNLLNLTIPDIAILPGIRITRIYPRPRPSNATAASPAARTAPLQVPSFAPSDCNGSQMKTGRPSNVHDANFKAVLEFCAQSFCTVTAHRIKGCTK